MDDYKIIKELSYLAKKAKNNNDIVSFDSIIREIESMRNENNKLYVDLVLHFLNQTQEEFEQEWEELKQWNEVGPDFREYVESITNYGKNN